MPNNQQAVEGDICPVCDRSIAYSSLGTDMEGNLIFEFHYDRRTGSECRASRRGMSYALIIRERIDYNNGLEERRQEEQP